MLLLDFYGLPLNGINRFMSKHNSLVFYQILLQQYLKMYKITAGMSNFCHISKVHNGQNVKLSGTIVANGKSSDLFYYAWIP